MNVTGLASSRVLLARQRGTAIFARAAVFYHTRGKRAGSAMALENAIGVVAIVNTHVQFVMEQEYYIISFLLS